MTEISYKDFLTLDKSNKILVFTTGECGLCSMQQEKIKQFENVFFVKGREEDLMFLDIKAVPLTELYDKSGNCVFKKYGLFSDKQIEELKECHDRVFSSQE